MKRSTITTISTMLCGLVVSSVCGGVKKNVQDTEGQMETGGNAPGGYLMPAVSADNFYGDFTTMTSDYDYLMSGKGLFLKMYDIRGAYGTNIYTYVMDGDNIQCIPRHFTMIVPRGGDKLGTIIKKSSMKNAPSSIFISTPGCENPVYVVTEKATNKYYYLCGDAEVRYKSEDLFENERCAEFKNLVDNYGE